MSELFDQSALADRAAALVAAAERAGADAADAVASRGVSLSVEVRLGAMEETERSEADALGLRVIVGQRQAVVSTRDPRAEGFAALAERAVAMARAAPVDRFAGLAPRELLTRDMPDLDLLDRTEPTADDLLERALAAEAAALDVAGVTNSGGASASWGLGGMVLVTSDGFSGTYLGSRHGSSVAAVAGEGTAMERDHDFSVARHLEDLDPAGETGRRAGERAVRRLNPQKLDTAQMPVVFDPRVATGLVGTIASALNGASVARGASFLAGALGERIMAEGITIVDDPTVPRGLRSHPFDGEGVSPRRLALVEDGTAKSFVLDCTTARELGLETTGHAARGVSSPPSPSASNLTLEPGRVSRADLIAGVSRGLYVTEMIGHGANIVTGNYSRGASGFLIENGELTHPVSEVTIAGDLRDMLRRLVPADDTNSYFGITAPTLLIEGLTVAGR